MKIIVPIELEIGQKLKYENVFYIIKDFSTRHVNLSLLLGEPWHAIHYESLPILLLSGKIEVYSDLYVVLCNGKYADGKGFPKLKGTYFDKSTYQTFEEALKYAIAWTGDAKLNIEINTPINSRSNKLEIRKI